MIKVIKTGNIDNFFIDKITSEKIIRYNKENKNLMLVTRLDNGSVLNVNADQIECGYGGQISFEYGNDKYIVDDGYQDLLIRAGYIVLNNYDNNYIHDKEAGLSIRNDLYNYIFEVFDKMWTINHIEVDKNPQQIKIEFEKEGFKFTVFIDTVNNIVNKNQQRKITDLPFYPFIKNMDKYGTMYLSMFAQKIDDDKTGNEKYEIAENFIIDTMEQLNEYATENEKYRFERIIIKKRINNWEGI